MTNVESQNLTPATKDLVLHGTARFYDLLGMAVPARSPRYFS